MAWAKQFKMKDLLTTEDVEDEEAQEIGRQVADRLRGNSDIFGLETGRFASRFENATDQDEFNDVLSDLYDVADMMRVWIE